MRSLILLSSIIFAFSGLAGAQTPGTEEHGLFGGLDDTNAPDTIDPSRSQSLLNVETNIQGTSIGSRPGYALALPLPLSTAPVTGSYSFIDASGNRQDLVCQDRSCYKSTNQAAFVVFITSGGRTGAGGAIPSFWTFAQTQGTVYIANSTRDQLEIYDGSTLTSSTVAPKGSQVEMTSSRLAVSDVAASPNSVYYSQSGVYTNFVAGVNSPDPYVDNLGANGDRTTAMRYARGKFWVWKSNSITSCLLGDQYTSQCRILSSTVGTLDPLSIVEAPDGLYFRDQNRNFWRLNENGLTPISLQIKTLVASQAAGSVHSNTQTSQVDWIAGSQFPVNYSSAPWDYTTIPGSIFPSSSTLTDSTTAQFMSGSVLSVSTNSAGRVALPVLFQNSGFETAVATPSWTINNLSNFFGTAFSVGGNASCGPIGVGTLNNQAGSNYTYGGTYTLQVDPCAGPGSGAGTCNQGNPMYGVYIINANTSAPIFTQIWNQSNLGEGVCTYESFDVSTVTVPMKIFLTDLCNANNVSSPLPTATSVAFSSGAVSGKVQYGLAMKSENHGSCSGSGLFSYTFKFDLFDPYYQSSGTLVSNVFDTHFTTPTWGTFSSTYTLALTNEVSAVFYTQVSTSPNNDMWDGKVSSSDTVRILSAGKRYARFEADFQTFISSKSPIISVVALNYATTGQFATQCIQPDVYISSWGAIACDTTISGGGSLVFYATSAASCATLPTSDPTSWQTTVANNTTLNITTNTAVKIGWRSLLSAATDVAMVNACTLYWNNGVVAPPVWGAMDTNRNALYWTTAVGTNTVANNRLLKYDLNRFEWFPFDIAANAPRYINGQLYFGSPSSGNWYLYGNGALSDAGLPINSYWKSKDFSGSQPFVEKLWQDFSFVARNYGSGSLNITWNFNNGKTGGYSVSMSTDASKPYIRSNVYLPASSKTTFMSTMFGNNAASQPWEVNAFKIDYTADPWRVLTP